MINTTQNNELIIVCPACKTKINLPATSCPSCGYDFKTGSIPEKVSAPEDKTLFSSKKIYFIFAFIAIAVLLLILILKPDKKVQQPPQTNLNNDSITLMPAKIIRNSKDTAVKLDQHNKSLDENLEE